MKPSLSERLINFLKPFDIQAAEKILRVQISELGIIPSDMHTDWKIYDEILFHLIKNSVKFNKFGGSILFDFSYQELEFPEDFVLDEMPSLQS